LNISNKCENSKSTTAKDKITFIRTNKSGKWGGGRRKASMK